MAKDYMTVNGIKKREEGSIYWEFPGDEDGIFYYPDKETGFLFRQVLAQDVELVKKCRETEASKFWAIKNQNGKKEILPLNQVCPENDEEVLKAIEKSNPKNNDDGSISLLVFNMRFKEFIACIDVMPIQGSDEEAALGFTFSRNKLIEKRHGDKMKKRIKEILIEERICKNVKEEVWYGDKTYLIPM